MGPDTTGNEINEDISPLDAGHSFLRGLLVTLGIYSLSIPLLLAPIVGLILALTLVPYLASSLGTRRVQPRMRIPLSLSSSAIWSLFETAVLIAIMSSIETPRGFVLERIGLSFIVILWTLNIIFGALGALRPWMDPFKAR
ncbi:MAG: hypothetical protein QCI82_00160 [Candidatus Thermoplasmatota archaeon]|nr:hypothetical protein [Candidatus Thermoplasmatota archaeon]